MSINAHSRETSGTECSVCVDVIEEVAKQTGTDPLSLPPLADSIAPEALNSLFASTGSTDRQTRQIEFQYYGHRITVSVDETRSITVAEKPTT